MKKLLILILVIGIVLLSCGTFKGKTLAQTNEVKSYYLIHPETGTVLTSQNEKERYPIASMVKMMTILLTLDEINAGRLSLDEKVLISSEAAGMGGSQMFLDNGESYSVADLLKGAIVVSANDACVALAEKISGSQELFVERMNKKAKELQMNNTNYVNCTGLEKEGGYSCAEDVAKVTSEILHDPIYGKFSHIWNEDFVHPSGRKTVFTNTNKLVRFFPDCIGGKTGFTSAAGFCLSAGASRNGLNVIAVVIGAESSDIRFNKVKELFNYAFANYEVKPVSERTFSLEGETILKANDGVKSFTLDRPLCVFKKKSDAMPTFKIEYEFYKTISAPIKKGTVVGKAILLVGDKSVQTSKLIANQDIEALSYKNALGKVLQNW